MLYLAGKIAGDINADELKHERIIYLGILSAEQLKEQMQNMHFLYSQQGIEEKDKVILLLKLWLMD